MVPIGGRELQDSSRRESPVEIEPLGRIPDVCLRGLSSLLREMVPIASIPDLGYLARVLVVPNDRIEATVNELLRQSAVEAGTYVAGPHPAEATAVPVEKDGTLACYVVLSESKVGLIYPGRYHPQELVSSLLEELLHVRVYVTAWQSRGYLYPPGLTGPARDLFVLCSRFHDEYMAARWKAAICSSVPLFDDGEGGLTTAPIWYGANLRSALDQAGDSLVEIIGDASAGTLAGEDAWEWITGTLYRGVFEPLAREEGFRAGNPPSAMGPYNSPADSRFYRRHVELYWGRARVQLERSFRSDLTEMSEASVELMAIVTEFLARLGVTHHEAPSGEYEFGFDVRPLARERRARSR